MAIALKRAYEKPSLSDGFRVLVDRLWPRGISKDAAQIDLWLKQLAPSDELRRWFHTHTNQWPAFCKRYLRELSSVPASAALNQLHQLANEKKKMTLVFASKDEEHNNAVVLRDLVEGMRKPQSSSGPAAAASVRSRVRVGKENNFTRGTQRLHRVLCSVPLC